VWWILVWAFLLLTAVAVIGLLGWRLFRQVLALGREVGASGGRAGAAMAGMRQQVGAPAPSSVFLDPDSPRDVNTRSRGRRHRRA